MCLRNCLKHNSDILRSFRQYRVVNVYFNVKAAFVLDFFLFSFEGTSDKFKNNFVSFKEDEKIISLQNLFLFVYESSGGFHEPRGKETCHPYEHSSCGVLSGGNKSFVRLRDFIYIGFEPVR